LQIADTAAAAKALMETVVGFSTRTTLGNYVSQRKGALARETKREVKHTPKQASVGVL